MEEHGMWQSPRFDFLFEYCFKKTVPIHVDPKLGTQKPLSGHTCVAFATTEI